MQYTIEEKFLVAVVLICYTIAIPFKCSEKQLAWSIHLLAELFASRTH